MKQISLMDSFLKKSKEKQEHTNEQQHKTVEKPTAEKIHTEQHHTPAPLSPPKELC